MTRAVLEGFHVLLSGPLQDVTLVKLSTLLAAWSERSRCVLDLTCVQMAATCGTFSVLAGGDFACARL